MNKKLNPKFVLLSVFALFGLFSCSQNNKETTITEVIIEPLAERNDFPNAKIDLLDISTVDAGDSVRVTFNFNVTNFQLATQTLDESNALCANSAQGQHIHFILDEKPYQALYKPTNTVTLAKNSEHTLLSFLSRSYHLSLKSPESSVLLKFKIDENGTCINLDKPTTPMLFFSRPKGEYLGIDTDNILLDFYVKNVHLSPSSYKVKVDIADTTFTVDNWQPYFIKGISGGTLKIGISLIDSTGNILSGNYQSISREVSLKP